MNRKKTILICALVFAALNLTACGKPNLSVNPKKPNATSAGAARVITSNNGGGTGGTNQFGATQALTYYLGASTAPALQSITVARSTSNAAVLRVNAPSVGNGTSICVITGASFTQCSLGNFFNDVGEERCNTIQNGVGEFTMARTDFNVVTVILYSHLQQFTAWYNGSIASNAYPTMAQGQLDPDYASCGY